MRRALQHISGLSDEAWHGFQSMWGHVVLWAATLVVGVGLSEHAASPYAMAPLVAGGASLFIDGEAACTVYLMYWVAE